MHVCIYVCLSGLDCIGLAGAAEHVQCNEWGFLGLVIYLCIGWSGGCCWGIGIAGISGCQNNAIRPGLPSMTPASVQMAGWVGRLAKGKMKGRMVRILDAENELDQRALAACLQFNEKFSRGFCYPWLYLNAVQCSENGVRCSVLPSVPKVFDWMVKGLFDCSLFCSVPSLLAFALSAF